MKTDSLTNYGPEELEIVTELAGKISTYFEANNQLYLDAIKRCKNIRTNPELERRQESTREFHIDYSERTRRLEEAEARIFQATYDEVTKEANELILKIIDDVSPLPGSYGINFSLSVNTAHANISSPKGNKYILDLNNPGQLVMEYKEKVEGIRGKVDRLLGPAFKTKSEIISLNV